MDFGIGGGVELLGGTFLFSNGAPRGGIAAVNGFINACVCSETESDELKIENGSSSIGPCSTFVV